MGSSSFVKAWHGNTGFRRRQQPPSPATGKAAVAATMQQKPRFLSLLRIDAFLSSDQSRCASKLLSAYAEADIEEIKRVAQSSTISNLHHVIIRLARKLPRGELTALKDETAKDEEALDENDLT
ncbi:hypothetical protein MRB53_024663 [Persea americana]|uniref:Uncharacterized protein n=1 Tax=Persea americana TaxID=3435 RepID=A0ACC2LDK1_PERAE|nr:hypothetical protein MRB53_024663 [Persea americana]